MQREYQRKTRFVLHVHGAAAWVQRRVELVCIASILNPKPLHKHTNTRITNDLVVKVCEAINVELSDEQSASAGTQPLNQGG